MMKKRLAFLLLIFFFTNFYAQNEQNDVLLMKVLKQLNIHKKDISKELYKEKVLPNKTSQTVLVIPKYRVNETDEYGHEFYELDAYIVVADNATGKIINKYIEESAWTSDAMVLTDIEIDTGLYQLNDKNRAFGIRVSYRGSSNPNPYSYTDLSLFLAQNNVLKKVLNNYQISRSSGEWDTRCAGEFTDIDGVIDIDKNKTNSFNNLIIKSKIQHTKSFETKDDCDEKVTTKNSTKFLKYNGKEYK